MKMVRTFLIVMLVTDTLCLCAQDRQKTDSARKPTVDEIARERQNPVSGLRSVFLQDVMLPVGEGNAHSFSIQPVWPFRLGQNWRLNTYTIIPIQTIPPITEGGSKASGLGNILFNAFIRPEENKGKIIWGIGPTLQIPTRTDPVLGSNRLSIGPAALVYLEGKKLSGGVVAQNFWSLGGTGINEVNLFSAQYILYYNFPKNWFVESNATITANWLAESGQQWIIPLGGGPGKTFQFRKHVYAATLQGFYNIEHPTLMGEWQLIVQFQIIINQ